MATIAVVGAGGIGTAIAGLLARSGTDVVLVGRSPAHVDAITTDGLRIDLPDGRSWHTPLEATVHPASAGPCDHVIVATKAFDTAAAARTAEPLVGPGTWVTTVQNGLGNDAVLAASFGSERVLPGLTTIGAERRAPGVVYVSDSTARGASVTHVGPPRAPGGTLEGARALAAHMDAAGLPVSPTDAIDQEIWKKLALAVMGPVSALLGATVGATWEEQPARGLVERLHDEVVAVAHAAGVPVDREASWAHAVATFEGTGHHYTSMATDIIQGRQVEIGAITGSVVDLAGRLGVDVPAASAVVALVLLTQQVGVRRIGAAPAEA